MGILGFHDVCDELQATPISEECQQRSANPSECCVYFKAAANKVRGCRDKLSISAASPLPLLLRLLGAWSDIKGAAMGVGSRVNR